MDDKDIPTKPVSNWQPITNKADLAILGKLAEELAEASAAVARTIIQGIESINPDNGKLNRHWLEEEFADVRAMMDHAQIRFNLDQKRMNTRRMKKFDYKKPWFDTLIKENK